jgi:hypothetical protein
MSTALKIRATQTRTTETRAVGSASRAGRLDAIWAGLPSADRFVLLGHDREVLEAGGSGWRRSLRLSRPQSGAPEGRATGERPDGRGGRGGRGGHEGRSWQPVPTLRGWGVDGAYGRPSGLARRRSASRKGQDHVSTSGDQKRSDHVSTSDYLRMRTSDQHRQPRH